MSEFQFEFKNNREEQKNAEEDNRLLPQDDHGDTTANSQDAPDDRKRKPTSNMTCHSLGYVKVSDLYLNRFASASQK